MELAELRSLVYVVRLGGFSRAAAALHLTQPAVSGHIGRLEKELDLVLLGRSARGPVLTPAGQAVWAAAEQVVALHDRIVLIAADLKALQTGEVRLACGATHAVTRLPPVLSVYTRQRPGLTLQLTVAASRQALHLLANRDVDVALVTTMDAGQEMEITPLFSDTFVAVAPPALANRSLLAGLTELGMIAFSPHSGLRRFVDAAIAARGWPEPAHVTEVDSLEVARSLAEAGLGCAFLPELAVREAVAAGRLALLPVPGEPLARTTYLCRPAGGYITPAASDLHDFLRQQFAGA